MLREEIGIKSYVTVCSSRWTKSIYAFYPDIIQRIRVMTAEMVSELDLTNFRTSEKASIPLTGTKAAKHAIPSSILYASKIHRISEYSSHQLYQFVTSYSGERQDRIPQQPIPSKEPHILSYVSSSREP
jgi:hypothetical protein